MHISELAPHHVENPREIVQPGDELRVKILEIDSDRRRLSLSAKRVEGQVLPVRRIEPEAGAEAAEDAEPDADVEPTADAGAEPTADAGPTAEPEVADAEPEAADAEPEAADAEPEAGRRRAPKPLPLHPTRIRATTAPPTPRRLRSRSARPTNSRAQRSSAGDVTVPFVGLTGGHRRGQVGSARRAGDARCGRLSSDAVVHELYATDAVRDAVRSRFGADVFEGETVDRGALARRVFARDEDRGWLEALLWPLVAERVEAFRARGLAARTAARRGRGRGAAPVRGGDEARYDATIAIVADDALRAARTAVRDQAELGRREARQLPQAEKARRADFVVVNDGTLDELREELRSVLTQLAP